MSYMAHLGPTPEDLADLAVRNSVDDPSELVGRIPGSVRDSYLLVLGSDESRAYMEKALCKHRGSTLIRVVMDSKDGASVPSRTGGDEEDPDPSSLPRKGGSDPGDSPSGYPMETSTSPRSEDPSGYSATPQDVSEPAVGPDNRSEPSTSSAESDELPYTIDHPRASESRSKGPAPPAKV